MALAVGDEIFSADSYNLPIPSLDDRKATTLDIRFSGSGASIERRRTTLRYSRR
jgi:hypothetical protein